MATDGSASSAFFYTLIFAILGYLAYLYFSRPSLIRKLFRNNLDKEAFSVRRTLFQRAAGAVFLGLIPGTIAILLLGLRFSENGMALKFELSDLIWMSGAGISTFFISLIISKFAADSEIYPQIRMRVWRSRLVALNALSWTIYLTAYEFLFRGILLFTSAKFIGYWPAIALNVFLYALAHWPKGIKEMLGAIPFGIALCLITLETGTIWAALLAHIVLALSSDHFSVLSNPDMSYELSIIKNKPGNQD